MPTTRAMMECWTGATLAVAAMAAMPAAAQTVQVVPAGTDTPTGRALPLHVGGRVVADADGYRRQWPGSYFESAFTGDTAQIRVGPGEVKLHVLVDDRRVATLVKPQPGLYRVEGLGKGYHWLRVEVASENQSAPTGFGGFYAASAAAIPKRQRQIEFIGDSHTVGYGNVASKRECSEAEVWSSTDTSKGIAGLTARRYGADYRVNAISGRGVVRNYNGFAADTLPVAYPYALFDHSAPADDKGWRPNLYVVALGTNDFTTPLHAGEKWADRAALHADYEKTYADFLRGLHARNPKAHLLVWATDMAEGEIAAEAGKVVETLRGEGIANIAFVPLTGLALSGCHSHPSVADDQRISDAVADYIDKHPGVWPR